MTGQELETIRESLRADLNAMEKRLVEKIEFRWGKVKVRDEYLGGQIRSLETLVKTGFAEGQRRMDTIEDWLKELEARVRKLETGQALSIGKVVGIAIGAGAGVSFMMWGIHMLLLSLRVFEP